MPSVLRIFKYLSNKFTKVKTTDESGKEIYLNMNDMRNKISTCLDKIDYELVKGKDGNKVYKNLKQISDYLEQILKARDRNWGPPEAEPKYPGLEKLTWGLNSRLKADGNPLIKKLEYSLYFLSLEGNVGKGSFWDKSLRNRCAALCDVISSIVRNTESNDFYLLNGEIIPTEKEEAMGINPNKETNFYDYLKNGKFPTIEMALDSLLEEANKGGKKFDYLCLPESKEKVTRVLYGVVDSSGYKESIVNAKGKLYVVPVQDPKLMQDVTLALRKQKQDYDEKNKIEYMKTKEMDEIFNETHVNKKKKKPKKKLFTLDSSEKNKDTELMVRRVTQLNETIDTAQEQLIDLRKSSTMVNLNNNEINNLNKKLSNTTEQVDNASKQLAEINTCLSQEKSLSSKNKEILNSKVELVSDKLKEVITQKDEIKKLVNEAKSEIIMNDINANHKKIQIDELIFTYNNNNNRRKSRNSQKSLSSFQVVDLKILLSKLDSDLTKAIEKFVEEQMKLVSNLKSCHFFEVGTNNDIHYYQLKWNTDTICKFQGTVVGVKPTVDEAQRNKLQEAINNVLKSMNKENNQKVNELNKKIESLNQKNEKLERLSNLINSPKEKDNIKDKLSGTNDEIITIRTDLKQLVKCYCTSCKLYTIANKLDTLESKIKVNEDTITKLMPNETPKEKTYILPNSQSVNENIKNPYKNSSNTDGESTYTPLPDLSNETNNEFGGNIYMDNKTQTDINFEVNKNETSEKSASNTRANTNQKDNMNTQDTKNSSVPSDTKQTDEPEKQKVEKETQTVMSEEAWIDAIRDSVTTNARGANSCDYRGQTKVSYWYADQLLFGLCISLSNLKDSDSLLVYVKKSNQKCLSNTIVKLFKNIFGGFHKSYAYYTSYYGERYIDEGYEDKLIDYDYSKDWKGGTIKNVDNIATALQTAAKQSTSKGFLKSLQDSGILNSTGKDVGDNYKSTDYVKK